jgi:hypothetical protein
MAFDTTNLAVAGGLPGLNVNRHIVADTTEPRCLRNFIGRDSDDDKAEEYEGKEKPDTLLVALVTLLGLCPEIVEERPYQVVKARDAARLFFAHLACLLGQTIGPAPAIFPPGLKLQDQHQRYDERIDNQGFDHRETNNHRRQYLARCSRVSTDAVQSGRYRSTLTQGATKGRDAYADPRGKRNHGFNL